MLPNGLEWHKEMDKGKVLGFKPVFYLLTFETIEVAALIQSQELDLINGKQLSMWSSLKGSLGPCFPKAAPQPWGFEQLQPLGLLQSTSSPYVTKSDNPNTFCKKKNCAGNSQ